MRGGGRKGGRRGGGKGGEAGRWESERVMGRCVGACACMQEVGVQTLMGHEGSVMALLATQDGAVLSAGLDGSIKVGREHGNKP